MKKKLSDNRVLIGGLILIGFSYYDFDLSLFLFLLFFQLFCLNGIFGFVKTYIKSKQDNLATGRIINLKKSEQEPNEGIKYEYTIEFENPETGEKAYLTFFRDYPIQQYTVYKIWVNPKKIENSIVLHPFNSIQLLNFLMLALFFIGITYININLFNKLFL